MNPDITQACWELGSACFGLLNIRAILRARKIDGVHWAPTLFFAAWGVYNLWFYDALNLPAAWWAGMAITAVNSLWLGLVFYFSVIVPRR